MTLQFHDDNPAVTEGTWLCIPTPDELSTQERYFARYDAERFEAEFTGLMASLSSRLITADIADFTELFFQKDQATQQQIVDLLNS
jgi:hypothetical protein